MTNNLKTFSHEWDALEMLATMKTPDDNASAKAWREYWLKLREVAKVTANGAMLAALNYGKAEERERSRNE